MDFRTGTVWKFGRVGMVGRVGRVGAGRALRADAGAENGEGQGRISAMRVTTAMAIVAVAGTATGIVAGALGCGGVEDEGAAMRVEMAPLECGGGTGDYQDVTIADLAAHPDGYRCARVAVTGEPAPGPVVCRDRAAASAGGAPCTATLRVNAAEASLVLRTAGDGGMGCEGDAPQRMACGRFPAQHAGDYRFEGVFDRDPAGTLRLRVDRHRALSCSHQGCFGELCVNSRQASPCIIRPRNACFQAASCGVTASGFCGWTDITAVDACISGADAP